VSDAIMQEYTGRLITQFPGPMQAQLGVEGNTDSPCVGYPEVITLPEPRIGNEKSASVHECVSPNWGRSTWDVT
jgi:hypothetical protein